MPAAHRAYKWTTDKQAHITEDKVHNNRRKKYSSISSEELNTATIYRHNATFCRNPHRFVDKDRNIVDEMEQPQFQGLLTFKIKVLIDGFEVQTLLDFVIDPQYV